MWQRGIFAILIFAGYFVLFIFIPNEYKKVKNFVNKHYSLVAGAILIGVLVTSLMISFKYVHSITSVNTYPNEAGMIADDARNLINGKKIPEQVPFAFGQGTYGYRLYSENVYNVTLWIIDFAIMKLFGINNFYNSICIINSLLVLVIAICLFIMVRKIISKKIALLSLILVWVLIAFNFFTIEQYTYFYPMVYVTLELFILFNFYFAKRKLSKIALMILLGILSGWAYSMKPTCLLITIVGLIVLVLLNRKNWKCKIIFTVLPVVVIIITIVGYQSAISYTVFTDYKSYKEFSKYFKPITNPIVIGTGRHKVEGLDNKGLDPRTGGEIWGANSDNATMNQEKNIEFLKKYFSETPKSELFRRYWIKYRWNVSDEQQTGQYWYLKPSVNYNLVNSLNQFKQGLYLLVWLMIGCGLFFYKNLNQNQKKFALVTGGGVCSIMAFTLVFEGAPRYISPYYPIIIFCSLFGIDILSKFFIRRIRGKLPK
jgi:4-amino-4-deoxy-L-arabinose transferase-like glycosyltransferase